MYIRLVTNYTGLSSLRAEITERITDTLISLVILGSLDRLSWKHTDYRRAAFPPGRGSGFAYVAVFSFDHRHEIQN